MAQGDVTIRFSAQEANYVQTIVDAATALTKMEQGAEKVGKATKEAAAEQKKLADQAKATAREEEQLGRAAKRIFEEVQTPVERLNAKLKTLEQGFAAGGISAQQFKTASDRLITSIHAAGQEGEKAGKSMTSAFGPQLLSTMNGILGALGIQTGIAGAISIARRELEAFAETEKRFARRSQTVEAAQLEAFQMTGVDSKEARAGLERQVAEMADRTGVEQRILYKAVGAAGSARGTVPLEKAMEAVEISARANPYNEQAMIEGAGAILDVMKATGKHDAKGAMGNIVEVTRAARVQNPADAAQYVAPVIAAATSRGGSEINAGAIFAALTQSMVDKTGRLTKTAAINLMKDLDKFLPEKDLYEEQVDEAERVRLANERAALDRGVKAKALEDPEYLATRRRLAEEQQNLLRRPDIAAKKEEIHGQMRRVPRGPAGETEREALKLQLRELGKAEREELDQQRQAALAEAEARITGSPQHLERVRELQQRENLLKKNRQVVRRGTGLRTPEQKLAYLQANPQEAQRIFSEIDKAGIEAAAATAVKTLIFGQGQTMADYQGFLKSIPAVEQAAGSFDRWAEVNRGSTIQRVAKFRQKFGTVREGIELNNPYKAAMGVIREEFRPLMQDLGNAELMTDFDQLVAGASYDKAESFAKSLERERLRLVTPRAEERTTRNWGSPGAVSVDTTPAYTPGPAQLELGQKLGELAEATRELKDIARQQLEEQRNQNKQPRNVTLGRPDVDPGRR